MANLAKHIENVRAFGIQPVVAINTRPDDEPELLELIKTRSLEAGAFGAAIHNGFGQGGEGTIELAEVVAAAAEAESDFQMLYADDEPIATKIEKIATTVYGADGIELAPAAREAIARFEKQGLAHLPICMAKTHLSLSHDPLAAQPADRASSSRSATSASTRAPACSCRCAATCCRCRASARKPAAFAIDIDEHGETVGLF